MSLRRSPCSRDGTKVFVTGIGNSGGRPDVGTTIAYDATTGAELWLATYQGPGAGDGSDFYAVAGSPDSTKVYVTGYANGTCTTIAYDAAAGTQLWLSQPIGSTCRSIAVSRDGAHVYVTGDDSNRWHTQALDTATGAELWSVQHVGGYAFTSIANGLALSRDGTRVFVTGYEYTGETYDGMTVAYSTADGTPLWTSSYDNGGDDYNNAVAVSPDGTRVMVTGSTASAPYQPSDYNTIAYDAATGGLVWDQHYDASGGYDTGRTIGVSVDGRSVFVSGDSEGTDSDSDYATVAYELATGMQRWVSRYNGPGNGEDVANAMAVGPRGNLVYVTGNSTGTNGKFDFATLALNSNTGRQVWALRYEGPAGGWDLANAIAVSPSGQSVFATGSSEGVGTLGDFATQGRIS